MSAIRLWLVARDNVKKTLIARAFGNENEFYSFPEELLNNPSASVLLCEYIVGLKLKEDYTAEVIADCVTLEDGIVAGKNTVTLAICGGMTTGIDYVPMLIFLKGKHYTAPSKIDVCCRRATDSSMRYHLLLAPWGHYNSGSIQEALADTLGKFGVTTLDSVSMLNAELNLESFDYFPSAWVDEWERSLGGYIESYEEEAQEWVKAINAKYGFGLEYSERRLWQGDDIKSVPIKEKLTLELPRGVSYLGRDGRSFSSFAGKVKTLVIPAMSHGYRGKIAENAFSGIGLESVLFKGELDYIGDHAFSGNCLTELCLPYISIIGAGAFADCDELKHVTVFNLEDGWNLDWHLETWKEVKKYSAIEGIVDRKYWNIPLESVLTPQYSRGGNEAAYLVGDIPTEEIRSLHDAGVCKDIITGSASFSEKKLYGIGVNEYLQATKILSELDLGRSSKVRGYLNSCGIEVAELLMEALLRSKTDKTGGIVSAYKPISKDTVNFIPKFGLISRNRFYGELSNEVIKVDRANGDGEIEVPNGVSFICKRAYQGVKANGLKLPSTLRVIDDYAFKDSTLCGEVIIPKSVKAIGDGVFSGTNIDTVSFSGGFPAFGCSVFAGMSNLSKIVIERKSLPYMQFIIAYAISDRLYYTHILEYMKESGRSILSREGTEGDWVRREFQTKVYRQDGKLIGTLATLRSELLEAGIQRELNETVCNRGYLSHIGYDTRKEATDKILSLAGYSKLTSAPEKRKALNEICGMISSPTGKFNKALALELRERLFGSDTQDLELGSSASSRKSRVWNGNGLTSDLMVEFSGKLSESIKAELTRGKAKNRTKVANGSEDTGNDDKPSARELALEAEIAKLKSELKKQGLI